MCGCSLCRRGAQQRRRHDQSGDGDSTRDIGCVLERTADRLRLATGSERRQRSSDDRDRIDGARSGMGRRQRRRLDRQAAASCAERGCDRGRSRPFAASTCGLRPSRLDPRRGRGRRRRAARRRRGPRADGCSADVCAAEPATAGGGAGDVRDRALALDRSHPAAATATQTRRDGREPTTSRCAATAPTHGAGSRRCAPARAAGSPARGSALMISRTARSMAASAASIAIRGQRRSLMACPTAAIFCFSTRRASETRHFTVPTGTPRMWLICS